MNLKSDFCLYFETEGVCLFSFYSFHHEETMRVEDCRELDCSSCSVSED